MTLRAARGGGGIASIIEDTSPQLGGFLDANGNYIQMQTGGDITSASPLVIDTDGDSFDVTGTTNFSALTVAADRHFFTQFDAILTMTHGGSLVLPGAANITTAAGDVAEWISTAANTVRCVNYTKADGKAVVSAAITEFIAIAVSDETTALETGTAKATFRMPYAFTLSAVRISVTTAPTSATILVDINEGGSTILSTKLMIDAGEKTSTTAATPAVISDSALADDAEITIDIDQIGSSTAGAGLKITLIGSQA